MLLVTIITFSWLHLENILLLGLIASYSHMVTYPGVPRASDLWAANSGRDPELYIGHALPSGYGPSSASQVSPILSTPHILAFVSTTLPATITLVLFRHLTSILLQGCPTWEWQHLTKNGYGYGL